MLDYSYEGVLDSVSICEHPTHRQLVVVIISPEVVGLVGFSGVVALKRVSYVVPLKNG